MLVNDIEEFKRLLHSDIGKFLADCERDNLVPIIRPNTASDKNFAWLAAEYPTIQFYDYTKSVDRMRAYIQGMLPSNYHLTYSVSELSSNAFCLEVLRAGCNVALVVDTPYNGQQKTYGPIPPYWNRFKTVDGDIHDIRLPLLDGGGKVICLRLKGTNRSRALGRKHGFARMFNRISLEQSIVQIASDKYKTNSAGMEKYWDLPTENPFEKHRRLQSIKIN